VVDQRLYHLARVINSVKQSNYRLRHSYAPQVFV
jgi:hypothetical protein